MEYLVEHWKEILGFLGTYTGSVAGVIMYVRGLGERVALAEQKITTHAEGEEDRINDLKEHVDEKFKTVDGRFDRLESKLDSLFVPRGTTRG